MIGINLVCCVLLTQRQWIVINATSVSRCDEVPVSLYLIMGQWQWKINYKLFSVLTWPHCAPPPAPPRPLDCDYTAASHHTHSQISSWTLSWFSSAQSTNSFYLKTNEHFFHRKIAQHNSCTQWPKSPAPRFASARECDCHQWRLWSVTVRHWDHGTGDPGHWHHAPGDKMRNGFQ